jgi:hypothetical protein
MTLRILSAVVALSLVSAPLGAQDAPPPSVDPLHKAFDGILDIYVRDGLVYYPALKQERAGLDRYVASLAAVSAADEASWSRERKVAFWVNAYNAFVLTTVIDNYPIRRRSPEYPAGSIRQIPGAFEKRTFNAAGRTVTLDGLERDIIVPLGEARAILALGRGAVGGGRLKSEAYTAERLEEQLASMVGDAVQRREMIFLDPSADTLSINPMFSWREALFVQAFADQAPSIFASRSPLERAVLGLISPVMLFSEKEMLTANTFRVVFHEFDWQLNDLTRK